MRHRAGMVVHVLGILTTSVTVVECVRLPLAPVTVKVYVPAGTELEAATFKVEEPEPPLMEVGLKVAVAPAGNPVMLKLIVPLKPLFGLTLAV